MFKKFIRRVMNPDPRSSLSYGEMGASGYDMGHSSYQPPNDDSEDYVRPKHKGTLPVYKKFANEVEALHAYNAIKSKLNTYVGVEFKEEDGILYVLIRDRYELNNQPLSTNIKITIDFSMLCLHARGRLMNNKTLRMKEVHYYAEKNLKDMNKYFNKLDMLIRRK